MKNLEYNIQIAAGKQKVWDVMLAPDTYRQWTDVSWPGSRYEGSWEKNKDLRFVSGEQGGGGTLATLTECRPHDYLLAKHVAIINADGSEDRTSDAAKGWVGTTESYTFEERNGKTNLKVEIKTAPEWADMFDDGWPKALEKLKELSEQ